jgi:putative membrane protein
MIITLIRTEFARLTSSRIGVAALVALMAVPLVYGGLYLWGNEDPYDRLDQVPAALVVDDAGATDDDGTVVDYGRDAVDTLLDGHDFGWEVVTDAEAKAGITAGTYDFGLTFPEDFSRNLLSASGDHPVEARVGLTTSDTNSYLSTTLAERAAESVRVSIAAQLGEEAASTLLDALDSVRDGLVQADDGATRLAEGATTAADGASRLATGAADAATGASRLASGTATLAKGAGALGTGLAQLDSQASALPSGTAALSSGAASVAGAAATAATGASALGGATAQAAALAPAARADVASAFASPAVAAALVASGIDGDAILARLDAESALTAGINTNTTTLATGLGTLSAGASQVATGAATLAGQAPALASAVHSAATGAAQVSSGAKSAATGAADLSSGLGTLSSGATDLSTGVASLASGSTELATSLGDAVDQIPGSTEAERRDAAAAISSPVTVDKTALTAAQNYGGGLAPFFISLAAWIGIYALFLLVRPLSRRALTAVRRPVRTTLAGWLTPALLGALQMLALFALVRYGLGLEVAQPVALVGFMVFVSVTFAAIVLALNVWLGSVGQFIGLILMVVQLVTAGGTFPWQTLPAPLAFIHQALPMSHAVDGIRQLMYGGSAASAWTTVWPLAAWLVVSLLVSVLGALKQGRYRVLRDLRPSPIGA